MSWWVRPICSPGIDFVNRIHCQHAKMDLPHALGSGQTMAPYQRRSASMERSCAGRPSRLGC
jgi:hypothetical protein